ncbi:MAG TPA: hypothetical protein VLL52_06715 [Anaerolineae bacterium]|nr:hypothetical protein [Anaerolineae bacterium]
MEDFDKAKSQSGAYEHLESEAGFFTRILEKVPGFKGYIQKERRKDADEMLRGYMSRRLDEIRLRLGQTQETLGRDIIKAIDYAEPLGQVDTRLMGLSGKIKDAPSAYTGFFAKVKIDEEELNNIYQFDESMLNYIDAIDSTLTKLDTAVNEDGDIDAAFKAFRTATTNANNTFNERIDLLKGMG